MNAHRVGVLAVVTVVALTAALWTTSTRRPQQEAAGTGALIEGLNARLDAIERVTLTGAGNATLATLQKSADGWTVVERRYPADTAKLRDLLRGLADAKKVEAKTSNPDQYAKLGVEDVAGDGAYGVQVELAAGDKSERWIIGQNTVRGQGTYLRAADQPQSWQIDRSLSVDKSTANWLQKDLADIAVERIEQVDVSALKGPAVAIVRAERGAGSTEGDFKLANVPKGREPASAFVADSTAGMLAQLKLDDVAAADAVQVDAATRRQSTFKTRDGITVTIESWQANEKTYAKLQAAFDEAAAKAAVEAAQAEERAVWDAKQAAAKPAEGDAAKPADAGTPPAAVADAAADAEARLQKLRDEVAQMSARFEGRVFVLPNHKAANLNRDLDAYLKPKA